MIFYKTNKMRKILLLLMLISFSAFGQPNPDYHRYGARTKFVQPDTLSTAQRTSLTPKLGTLIYHKDTGVSQWEQWDGDSWEELGGDGAVSSVNFKVGAVVIDPDDLYDFSTINKFVTQEEKELIFTALQDAPSDGNEYVRKDGDWEVATGGGDNIYTADGTLEGDRSINIGEHSLSVKDSLGMPLFNVANDVFQILNFDGNIVTGMVSANISGSRQIAISNVNNSTTKGSSIVFKNTDSTSIEVIAEKLIFDIEGTAPSTGDVLTLQPDGTTKFQAPSGGGGGTDDQTAAEVPFTPYETISATNVQDAIEEVLDEIPTSLAAANITVSPSIGGNTDTYAVMDDHEDRISDLEVKLLSSATITMNGHSIYNDIATDAATLTLSDCDPGETLKMYINRSSMPTLAGTDLIFNQLPNTPTFEADTNMVITFVVTPVVESGDTVIDYYLTIR